MNLSSVKDGKESSSCVVFILYFLEQQTLGKLQPLGLTHHAIGISIIFPKCSRSPWKLASYSRMEVTKKTLACELLLGSRRTGSIPPSDLRVAWHFQSCAGMVKCHSLSAMMVPKQISFGIALAAGVCVLVEDKISAMLVWICYKLFEKLILTNISFPSLYNSVFEAYRELKGYIFERFYFVFSKQPLKS